MKDLIKELVKVKPLNTEIEEIILFIEDILRYFNNEDKIYLEDI